jgi:hypothetical protein
LELPLVEAFGPDKLTTLVLTLFKCWKPGRDLSHKFSWCTIQWNVMV